MLEPESPWSPDDSYFPTVNSRVESGGRVGRVATIALGVVALALITRPELLMPLGCVTLGWDEIRASRWLKRVDPDRDRGRACSRFYLAWGFWRITLAGIAMMFLVILARVAMEGKGDRTDPEAPPPPGFIGCGITTMIGLLLAISASLIAMASALRGRVAVWVGPEAAWARSDGTWPPQLARRRGKSTNRAKLILTCTLIGASTVLLILAITLLLSFAGAEARAPMVPAVIGLLFLLIGLPASILFLLGWLGTRMIAPSPAACWTVDE